MNYFYFYPEYFNIDSILSLLFSFLSFSLAIIFRNKSFFLKLFFFLGGASVAYFCCSLDDFLHNWDEQFHALVAKNMMNDPFNPRLYKNVLLVPQVESWVNSSIWLHKQPLFLWQMAISLKIFGVNVLALKIPNIIAHGLLVVMLYDIGTIVKNKITGYMFAIIFAFMRFPLMYAAGMEPTDHNDYMFLFYVTSSFWAFFKFSESQKISYCILLGIFVGCAILVKWLTGFLVIGVWFSYIIIFQRYSLRNPLLSLGVSLIVCLPWQIYCYVKYRSTFLEELKYNNLHITESLEGHQGQWNFHIEQITNLYSNDIFVYFILALSLFFFTINKTIDFKYRFMIIVPIFLVYVFFSVVQTKMPAFCMIVMPLVLLSIVVTLQQVVEKFVHVERVANIIYIFSALFFISYFMDPSYFLKRHTLNFTPNEHRMHRELYTKKTIMAIGNFFKDKKIAIVNCKGNAIKMMFYIECDATDIIPEESSIGLLKKAGYQIICLKNDLPDFIKKDSSIIKL